MSLLYFKYNILYRIFYLRKMINQSKQSKTIKIDEIIDKLYKTDLLSCNTNSFPISESEIQGLCQMSRIVLSGQPMLLQLKPPVNICGDIHGQFKDLMHLLDTIGQPGIENYLFLGDYVDRGKRSLECFCLLMALKIKYPHNFFLLRGNHQCSQVNKIYGFYDECKRKFNVKLWKSICDTFDYLPIAAVVGDRIFCVHGGISPNLKNIRDLNTIKRPIQPNKHSIISDMLWSDPSQTTQGWSENQDRGVGYYFGNNIIDKFLEKYDFDLLCRSHQVVEEGYHFMNKRKSITVFSAPNYCGQFQNMGAVLRVGSDMKCAVQQFQSLTFKEVQKHQKRSLTPIPVKKDVSPSKGAKQKQKEENVLKMSLKANTFKSQNANMQDTNSLNSNKRILKKVTNLYSIKKKKSNENHAQEGSSNENTIQYDQLTFN